VGSYPAGGKDASVVSVVCGVWYLSPRGVDHLSRGVVPNVVCNTLTSRMRTPRSLDLSSHEKSVDHLTHKYHSLSTQKLQRTVSK